MTNIPIISIVIFFITIGVFVQDMYTQSKKDRNYVYIILEIIALIIATIWGIYGMIYSMTNGFTR